MNNTKKKKKNTKKGKSKKTMLLKIRAGINGIKENGE